MCSVLCFTVCFIVYVPFLHRQCSVNVVAGESEDDRMMTTGLHTVRDIFCVACGAILGWKYVSAFEKDQRYKEGKFILERSDPHASPFVLILLRSPLLLDRIASYSALLQDRIASYSALLQDRIASYSCSLSFYIILTSS